MDKKIILKPLYHREQESIALVCENAGSLNTIIKKLPGAKWSQTKKLWYVPLNAGSYNNVYKALNEKVDLEVTALKEYLEKRKKVAAAAAAAILNKSITKSILPARVKETEKSKTKFIAPGSPVWNLCPPNLEALEKYVQHLKLQAYSEATIQIGRASCRERV